MKNHSTTFVLCLLLFFQSCSEKERKCDVACTEEYRTITVSIKDSESKPVALDYYEVVDLENGRDLTLQPSDNEFQNMRETGAYPLFSDKYVQEYFQQQLEIKFTGYINGEEVVSEDYIVGANCCHVYRISGDLELELE